MDPREIATKHLGVLEREMNQLSTEASQFAGRFLFGGIVAVIALLNTDLLIEEQVRIPRLVWPNRLVLIVVVLVVSGLYFRIIAERILHARWRYRLARYRYDVTFYALLFGCSTRQLLEALEHPLKSIEGGTPTLVPQSEEFSAVAHYLRDHHSRALSNLRLLRDWLLGMIIVSVVVLAKVLLYWLND